MPRPRKYATDEERREAVRQTYRKYYNAPPRSHQRAASETLQEQAGGHHGGVTGDLGGNMKNPRATISGRRGGLARGQVDCIVAKRASGK